MAQPGRDRVDDNAMSTWRDRAWASGDSVLAHTQHAFGTHTTEIFCHDREVSIATDFSLLFYCDKDFSVMTDFPLRRNTSDKHALGAHTTQARTTGELCRDRESSIMTYLSSSQQHTMMSTV